jgi:signal transduction histidine kinase
MSLRRRLTLSLVAILVLFSINVGTHFWGSYARRESMVAYRDAVTAAQLSTELEQILEDQWQQIRVLATLRETTEDRLEPAEQQRAIDSIEAIRSRVATLGGMSQDVIQLQYQRLQSASSSLLDTWLAFFENYNDSEFEVDVEDPLPFVEASQRLKELEQRQAFIAVQRANVIDRTIALTDRITLIGFVASIFLTATLGFFLVRYTNSALKRLRRGTERFGSGDLDYRINSIDDNSELGDLARAFNTMSDKLRDAIEDVRTAKDQADEANAAKSIFLANVSHELRTPLNAIIGYSEMLRDELEDEAQINREQFSGDLQNIVVSGRQLLGLIDDILDLSKIETGKMTLHEETFDPGSVIGEVCESLMPLIRERSNTLDVGDLAGLPQMNTDLMKFRQIFTNLLSNANKFTENGRILVRAEVLPDAPDTLCFTVADTGIGMDAAAQERIFEAFVQAEASTSAAYGGTGLGLAICRDFCAMMGGSISVTSKPGEGSRFTVLLPAAPASAHAAA